MDVVLNLITPSFVIAGPGLDAVSPAGTARPLEAVTSTILPIAGLRTRSLEPNELIVASGPVIFRLSPALNSSDFI